MSVASNVAEGYARRTARGYGHYIMVAYGALLELDTQFEIAVRAGYLANDRPSPRPRSGLRVTI